MNNKDRLISTINTYEHRLHAIKPYMLLPKFRLAYYKTERLLLGLQIRLDTMYY